MPQSMRDQFELAANIDQLLDRADKLEKLDQKFEISANDRTLLVLAKEHRQIYDIYVKRDFSDPSSSSSMTASRFMHKLAVNSERKELFALQRNINHKLDRLMQLVEIFPAQKNAFEILDKTYHQLQGATKTRASITTLLEKVTGLLDEIQGEDSIVLIRERIDQLKILSQELENSSSEKIKKISKDCHNLTQKLQSKIDNKSPLNVTKFIPKIDSFIGLVKSNRSRINNIGLYKELDRVEALFRSKVEDLKQKSIVATDTNLTLEYKKLSEDCSQNIGWLIRKKANGSVEELKTAITTSNKSFESIKKSEAEFDNQEESNPSNITTITQGINRKEIQQKFNHRFHEDHPESIQKFAIDPETQERLDILKSSLIEKSIEIKNLKALTDHNVIETECESLSNACVTLATWLNSANPQNINWIISYITKAEELFEEIKKEQQEIEYKMSLLRRTPTSHESSRKRSPSKKYSITTHKKEGLGILGLLLAGLFLIVMLLASGIIDTTAILDFIFRI